MKHLHTIKVRGFHTDMFGHVNNARYLEFLEEARWEFLEHHMDYNKWEKLGNAFIVANINISYKRPSKLGEMLEIQSNISELGERSGVVHQEIFLKDQKIKIAAADVTFVIINIRTKKSVIIEGEMKEIFQKLVISN